MKKPSRFVASFDSASAMLRAGAGFLHGQDFPYLGSSALLWPLVAAANYLPPTIRRQAYKFGGWAEAVPDRLLDQFDEELTAQWVVDHNPRRSYPAVAIGSSCGAAVHLCCALGIPWLPQTLLLPVRKRGIPPDDLSASMEAMRPLGERLLRNNPHLQLHHMHDPNQDRLMVQIMAYFRVKRRTLGAAYEKFFKATLQPGGTIFLLDCALDWPTTQVADRYYFQAGALGGVTPHEMFHGSPKIAHFLEREGSPARAWQPPPADGTSPEAEWGLEPALAADLERFADEQGYRIEHIKFSHPQHLSPLVADLYRWWYEHRGRPADRLLVESFILMEPYWTIRGGAIPYWSFFPVESAVKQLEEYLDARAAFENILVMLFSHGVRSAGYAPINQWHEILQRSKTSGDFVGVNHLRFPRDFSVFAHYYHGLRKRLPSCPPISPLTLRELEEFLERHSSCYQVRWQSSGEAALARSASKGKTH